MVESAQAARDPALAGAALHFLLQFRSLG